MLIIRNQTIDFGSFKLTIDGRDYGGRMYRGFDYWADLIDPLEKELINKYQCQIFLDIGANYGFTSLVNHSLNSNLQIIAVEPSPNLIKYLKINLTQNNCLNFRIIHALCSDYDSESPHNSFFLNPRSSQDNRVMGLRGWKKVQVPSVTVTSLLKEKIGTSEFIFIKIDTQGFEEKVFLGAHDFLGVHSNWLIKTEFAPQWLESQGTDPRLFLENLVEKYSVYELPKRTRYYDSLALLKNYKISKNDCENFVNYTRLLANGNGWCDLLITHSYLTL
jgi:FkbM family methyltransferase